ncbi:MAG: DUF4327 family protein [Xenococcaceae cyanobacterium]
MPTTVDYSISEIKDEARHLVEKGAIDRQQPIYILCKFIPPREWVCVECELEINGYLLRDHICDLLSKETWEDD